MTPEDLMSVLEQDADRESHRKRLDWAWLALAGAALGLACLAGLLGWRRSRLDREGSSRMPPRVQPEVVVVRDGMGQPEGAQAVRSAGDNETALPGCAGEESPRGARALETAEALERLGGLVASEAVPLGPTLAARGLHIARDWASSIPVVERLRRTDPVLKGGREARVDWLCPHGEWLASLAGVSLASSWEGAGVDRVLARIGPLSHLERRARELTRDLDGSLGASAARQESSSSAAPRTEGGGTGTRLREAGRGETRTGPVRVRIPEE